MNSEAGSFHVDRRWKVDAFTWIIIAALGVGVLIFSSARETARQEVRVRPRRAMRRKSAGGT
jgi:hypothetical protein